MKKIVALYAIMVLTNMTVILNINLPYLWILLDLMKRITFQYWILKYMHKLCKYPSILRFYFVSIANDNLSIIIISILPHIASLFQYPLKSSWKRLTLLTNPNLTPFFSLLTQLPIQYHYSSGLNDCNLYLSEMFSFGTFPFFPQLCSNCIPHPSNPISLNILFVLF